MPDAINGQRRRASGRTLSTAQEFTIGACCIAAPVRDGRNTLVAALGISVPARRFEVEQRTLVRVIRDLAAEASMALGA